MEARRLATITSSTLLEGLKDPANHSVWSEYVERYRPMIVRTAQRAGLCESDAEDVAQNSLVDFASAYRSGGYSRERGKLRSWLFGIVRNRIRQRRAEQGPATQAAQGDTALAAEVAPDEFERLWDEEWRDAVLRRCTEEVRTEVEERTFEAFRRFALEGRPAEEVAAELGMTANAVSLAKRRVLERIRDLLPLLEETW